MKSSMQGKFKHVTRPEIRFVDVDVFGHVNNAHYLTYFEQARVRYFDDIVEWNYSKSRQGVIVARAEINFSVPALFRDHVTILTRCSRIGTKSFDLEYRMMKMADGIETLLADGNTVMVAFDYAANRSIEIPDSWKEALKKYEGDGL
jgi:acyl-CoA thioester hydrolase